MLRRAALVMLALAAAAAGFALLFPEAATQLAIAGERARSGFEHRSLAVDGTEWYYLEAGPIDSEAVVLVHGFGGDKDNWLRFARHFSERYRVIALDLPGFGETTREPDRDYRIPAQAEALEALLAALDLERFHLLGHSMGGHLAAYYAHRHPADVATLALVTNSGLDSPVPSELQELVASGESPLIPETEAEYRRLVEFASFEPPFIPWPVSKVLAREAVAAAPFKRRIRDSLLADRSARLEPLLPEIEMPVFVLWGRHDRLLDVTIVDVIKTLVPHARSVILEDAGHLPMLERPAESARHYLEFLDAR
ncbi:MAG: alpha/beta fold hydrolase [Pseudomonadota bacterium]